VANDRGAVAVRTWLRAPAVARGVALIAAMLLTWAMSASGGPPQEHGNAPVCARALQGRVRLADGTPVPRAVVEQRMDPGERLVFRVRKDRRGWFEFPGGRPKRGTHILLRISAPGLVTTDVRLRIDAACGDPTLRRVASAGGGAADLQPAPASGHDQVCEPEGRDGAEDGRAQVGRRRST
jgi:hypothetical protein